MRSLLVLSLLAPFLASAYPTYAPVPTPTPRPTPTACATTCPTSTITEHPGYRCEAGTTLYCPVAKCMAQSTITTTSTSIVPCSTSVITLPDGCTVPQTCVGNPVSTITVSATVCPSECPVLCPQATKTEMRLLGGGCPRTA